MILSKVGLCIGKADWLLGGCRMLQINKDRNGVSLPFAGMLATLTVSIVLICAPAFAEPKSKAPATPSAGDAVKIGDPAPDFELTDLDGNKVRLSQFKGKVVVLEWFNPECPFVILAHGRTLSLKEKAAEYAKKGVIWLAVNSNGPGKQGNGKEANIKGRARLGMNYPVLLDPKGTVGKQYGALRTPHMFVIDKTFTVVYSGAVDNTRGGDPEDAEPKPAKNYIDAALAAVLAGKKPVDTKTEPWGCSVKYAE